MRATKGLRGVITVYVSLVFLLVMSLLAALLETARVYGLRVRLQMASRGGLDSLFSMYSKPLFENFGILMLDESFGYDQPVADAFTNIIRENMKYDLEQNKGMILGRTFQLFDLKFEDLVIAKTIRAVDDGGVYFAQSAIDMMKYRVPASAFTSFTSLLGMYENAEAAKQSIEEGGGAVESEDWNTYVTTAAPETLPATESAPAASETGTEGSIADPGSAETEVPATTEEATTIDYNAEADEAVDKSIIGVVKDFLKGNVLKIYGLKEAEISKGKRNIKEAVSKKHSKDKVSEISEGVMSEAVTDFLFGEYVMEYLLDFQEQKDKEKKNEGQLRYEVEYVLIGKDNDKDNLLGVLNRIYGTRVAFNSFAVLTNPQCQKEAAATASAVIGWTGIVPLVLGVQWLLLETMALAESVLDMRALVDGKKIPLFKSPAQWSVRLSNGVQLLTSGAQSKEMAGGFDYQTYERVLLFFEKNKSKYLQTMDIIEWDMQKSDPGFHMDDCVYAVEIEAQASAGRLFSKMIVLVPTLFLPHSYSFMQKDARSY
ncbi:MAG: hypothetical protein IKX10_02025 [Lachnospiraceae bacterium]|nr:hypothetical protein [Lachnospiraceae bacterium]